MYSQPFFILTIGLPLLTGTLGAVVSSNADKLGSRLQVRALEARSGGAVKFCRDWFYNGACLSEARGLNQCWNVDAYYNKQISSILPDKGIICKVWSNFQCSYPSGQYRDITDEGVGNLRDIGFNDAISSYYCYAVSCPASNARQPAQLNGIPSMLNGTHAEVTTAPSGGGTSVTSSISTPPVTLLTSFATTKTGTGVLSSTRKA